MKTACEVAPAMAFAAAHRGLSAEKPENTLAAFGAAVAARFPCLELDLRATRDGAVVVLHDDSLDRTTDGKGSVRALDWKECARLDTGAGGVPRLEDLFTMLKAWDGLYNLEFKAPEALAPALELVDRFGLSSRVCLSAMEPDILWDAEQSAPHLARAYIPLGYVEDDDVEMARDATCSWMNVDHDFLAADEVAKLRAAGFKLGAWTVNDIAKARELVGLGVDCVITDVRDVGAAVAGKASWM